LSGIIPGILIFFLFSLYCYVYSKIKKVGVLPKSSWHDRLIAIRDGLPVMGFPVIIIGGIYAGIFSPTEAAAVSVAYAIILEALVYRSLTRKSLFDSTLQAGVLTGAVFILVGAGQAFSWMIGFLQIPQMILPPLFGVDPSALRVISIIVISYFVACMFVGPIVVIFILSPIFQPYVVAAGVDPVLLGTLVTLQAAIGSATPPFGCDIFTAQIIFRRPYMEVIGHSYPFVIILIIATILIIALPQLALFLPGLAS
jgi:tripartite ATP-independent transporter DctM subunit